MVLIPNTTGCRLMNGGFFSGWPNSSLIYYVALASSCKKRRFTKVVWSSFGTFGDLDTSMRLIHPLHAFANKIITSHSANVLHRVDRGDQANLCLFVHITDTEKCSNSDKIFSVETAGRILKIRVSCTVWNEPSTGRWNTNQHLIGPTLPQY